MPKHVFTQFSRFFQFFSSAVAILILWTLYIHKYECRLLESLNPKPSEDPGSISSTQVAAWFPFHGSAF